MNKQGPTSPSDTVLEATKNQQLAADPTASVWVAASAGSGKTKVLTDRILRLLLTGVRPSKILALTFTNAAAAEMANRVSKRLREWSILEPEQLDAELFALLAVPPDDAQKLIASRLFADVLETPGGMRIQTTHSFCQSLLGRFPIEARVPPNFELLSDAAAEDLLEQARDSVLAQGFEDESSNTAKYLRILSRNLAEDQFTVLIKNLLSGRARISALFKAYADKNRNGKNFNGKNRNGENTGGIDAWCASLRPALDLAPGDTLEKPEFWFCDDANMATGQLRDLAAKAHADGSKTNVKVAGILQQWLDAAPRDRPALIDTYLTVWLTKLQPKKSGSFSKAIKEKSGFQDQIDLETQRCMRFVDKRRRLLLADGNEALMRLLDLMLKRFRLLKAANAKLDYDDLILKTKDLLQDQNRTQWVLYKLDEGLSHVLVDEAQDTNADQWDVITALIREFFNDASFQEPEPRTVFVVGDRKQSIYGFQRADPRVFDAKRDQINAMVGGPGRRLQSVELDISFRSVDAVLMLTDATLESEACRRGLVRDQEPWRRHKASRAQEPGRVCLWPVQESDPETAPVKSEILLAQRIARRIKTWIESGDEVQPRVRPGDILILLQNRKPLAKPLVRELQQQGIPVAGLDRMLLTEQLAVRDLIVLADFVLLPTDDLSLAAVLRSPLCNFSEQDLFDLAHKRGTATLWSRLRDQRDDRPVFHEAFTFLTAALNLSETKPAFEFFAGILSALNKKAAMIQRLGFQIDDPVQEFLNKAIEYEQEGPSSLQGFIHRMRRSGVEIKRDSESLQNTGPGEVRIMTAHGAKGLQAPVVILPDTTRGFTLKTHNKIVWQTPRQSDSNQTGAGNTSDKPLDTPWWIPAKDMAIDINGGGFLSDLLDRTLEGELEEKRRLLYVAMTRAEDSLHVMGYEQSRKANDETCWFNLMTEGFRALGPNTVSAADGTPVRCFRTGTQASAPQERVRNKPLLADEPLNERAVEFLYRNVKPEPVPSRPLTPSRPDEEDLPVVPPQTPANGIISAGSAHPKSAQNANRFQRGLLTHALLQHLPSLPPDRWPDAASAFLMRQRPALHERLQAEIWAETRAVLHHRDAGLLFGPDSQAEVPLVGLSGNTAVSGRVDRLVVTAAQVMIIDYKTNRPPPSDPKFVAAAYLRQMNLYRDLLVRIYPGRTVRRFLLWTDGCHLMEL